MFTIKSKIDSRLAARRNGESGLALLDVLLGMAIFALIAVIAVQAMGTFRERAYVTQVTSDAKQVGVALAAEGSAPNASFGYTAGVLSAAELTALGVNLTGGNVAHIGGTSFDDYTVCVDRASGAPAITYTASGGTVGTVSTVATGCAP